MLFKNRRFQHAHARRRDIQQQTLHVDVDVNVDLKRKCSKRKNRAFALQRQPTENFSKIKFYNIARRILSTGQKIYFNSTIIPQNKLFIA